MVPLNAHMIVPVLKLPVPAFLIPHGRVQIRLGDINSYIDKLLFQVINNSCFLDASWPGRSCPRGKGRLGRSSNCSSLLPTPKGRRGSN
jgi:hypothetical protein